MFDRRSRDHRIRCCAERVQLESTRIELRDALTAHTWPVSVREPQNTIRRFVILQDESFILEELQRRSAGVVSRRSATPTVVAPSSASPSLPRVDVDATGNGSARAAARWPDVVRAATLRAELRKRGAFMRLSMTVPLVVILCGLCSAKTMCGHRAVSGGLSNEAILVV